MKGPPMSNEIERYWEMTVCERCGSDLVVDFNEYLKIPGGCCTLCEETSMGEILKHSNRQPTPNELARGFMQVANELRNSIMMILCPESGKSTEEQ